MYSPQVLILVVVEDGLVHNHAYKVVARTTVLILVVVEDGLVLWNFKDGKSWAVKVLILIVVEDGLVQQWQRSYYESNQMS